ncbi:MAG TPA: efflux RND transporter periplasmic adaptor subunit [Gemmataceae bacterium]|nr:efflux RND transporter periplasmic adaptor subunit [Gemmataceae bacterium]
MNRQSVTVLFASFIVPIALGAIGCEHAPAGGQQKPPDVTVVQAVERQVTETVEFPGRTEAPEAVEIRARVSGYLEEVKFPQGGDVKVGDVLFEVDPKMYKADYDKAAGQVGVYEAKVKRLRADVERNAPLAAKGTVSREDFEKMVGDRDEAIAGLQSAKANLEGAKVNLDYTKIRSPITGKISRNLITVGNLVKADSTVLANIVSTQKIYAYFDVDENSYLRYEERVRKGEIKPGEGDKGVVQMTLGDGTVIKGGTVDYIDVQLSRGTGTILVRSTFPDPEGSVKAGQFVRVRLPITPQTAVLVPEVAVGSDQGLKYVYVVDDKDKVEYRRVTTGGVHDGMQVIDKGLKAGEWVVVKGLLRVRDGVTVTAHREDAAKQ